MTENDPIRSEPSSGEPDRPAEQEPDVSRTAGSPEYYAETGEAVGDDGSVVPIIGGLPAVQGSAWDVGAPQDDRGAGLAGQHDRPADQE